MTDETNKSIESRLSEPGLNRRRLLKVAVATAPIIATLPSGAALARSSNIISATSGPGTDALGRTQCLTSPTAVDGIVDLGADPHGYGLAMIDRNYRVAANGGADPISEKAMCQQGGTFYYQGTGWQSVNVPKGIVVSATALSSFAGSIYLTEV